MRILIERKKVIIPQGVIYKKGVSTKDLLSWTISSYELEHTLMNLLSSYDSQGETLITRVTDD